MGQPGDEIIIMAYGYLHPDEIADFKGPRVVRLAAHNKLG
jgi:aspartate 1-decarboxylase